MMLPVGCNPIKYYFAPLTGVVSFERNEFAHQSFGNEQSEADKHIMYYLYISIPMVYACIACLVCNIEDTHCFVISIYFDKQLAIVIGWELERVDLSNRQIEVRKLKVSHDSETQFEFIRLLRTDRAFSETFWSNRRSFSGGNVAFFARSELLRTLAFESGEWNHSTSSSVAISNW